MPGKPVFHEAHALALDGVSDDDTGFIWFKGHAGQGIFDLFVVVPVNILQALAKGPPLSERTKQARIQ